MNKSGFPKGIPYIIGNEFAERFSFYGMKAILITFLTTRFFLPEDYGGVEQAQAAAREEMHLFTMMAYLLPIFGGLLSDWFLGKFKTILLLSIVYCIGHFLLFTYDDVHEGFSLGLLVVAIGAGGIKSSVSAHVGDQFENQNDPLISRAFEIFYLAINVGAFISMLLIPYIRDIYGYSVAFGIPGVLMLVATIVFWMGRNVFKQTKPTGINKNNFLFISLYAFFNLSKRVKGKSWLEIAKQKFETGKVEDIKMTWKILSIFLVIPIYWAAYEQNYSSWVQQAAHLDLNINLMFSEFEIIPEQIQSINPFVIIGFVPLFSIVFHELSKKGIVVSPLKRMLAGFGFSIVAFVIVSLIQESIDKGGQPTVWWQGLAYFCLTIGEILIYATGLELSYRLAPKSMNSTIMGFWLLTIAVGNYIALTINHFISKNPNASIFKGANYFWFFTIITVVSGLSFYFVQRKIKLDEPKNDVNIA